MRETSSMGGSGIGIGFKTALFLLILHSNGAAAEWKTVEPARGTESGTGVFGSGAGLVTNPATGISLHRSMYLAAGGQGETDYIEAEELIELFSPEPTMTRSIRGIGGVTTGHTEARQEFRNILFDFDSDRLRQSSYPQLGEIGKALSAVMTAHPGSRFSIEGHTDSIGDRHYNLQLSQKRARAVKQYLVVRYGLDSSRIRAVGLGEAMPVAPNETELGRSLNRRVEVVRE